MRGRVPPMPCQIDAAAERQHIVDDNDLLVMGPADWMTIVECEAHLLRHLPHPSPRRQRLALERVQLRIVPREHVTGELWTAADHPFQQLVEARRGAVGCSARNEIERGLNIPAENEDRLARVQERVPDEAEIVGGVLNAGEAVGPIDAPTGVVRLKDLWRRGRRRRRMSDQTTQASPLLARRRRLIIQARLNGMHRNRSARMTLSADGCRHVSAS